MALFTGARQTGSNEYKADPNMSYRSDQKRDCYAINARALVIDNSDKSDCWQWIDSNGTQMAKAVNLKWLGVRRSFKTRYLTYGVEYKVSIKLQTTLDGTLKGQKVQVTLNLPNNNNQENPAYLPQSSTDWCELEIGRFTMTRELTGDMNFAMTQSFESWKSGLIIKCAEIKPVDAKFE